MLQTHFTRESMPQGIVTASCAGMVNTQQAEVATDGDRIEANSKELEYWATVNV